MEQEELGIDTSGPEAVSHLVSLIQEFDIATLITRQRAGALHARPMALAGVDDDATLWFVTSLGSPKVSEISEDARSMVVLQGSARFVSLNGKIDLVQDRHKIEEMWKEGYRVWYDGKSDPDIVLLRFTPYDAEYWDNSGINGIKYVFRAARAYVTGEPLKKNDHDRSEDPEVHAKMRL